MDEVRLTQLVLGGGCARKLPAEDLVEVLAKLPHHPHPWVRPTGPMDDAAVLFPEGDGDGLVYTMDIITPIVDDPRIYGQIAGTNAVSDVYAMGGRPQVALSYVGLPDVVGLDVLEAIFRGMQEKAWEAGCVVVGGHTIKSAEPQCGLAVIGTVPRDRVWTHTGGKAGQALVLTKAIGTGVISQATKKDAAAPGALDAAIASMTTLNRRACEVGLAHGATAATDVTGFSLLGHLEHLAHASGVAARLDCRAVPLLTGAWEAASAGHVPGGSRRNLRYVSPHLVGQDTIDPVLLTLLADAQTSGGLLLALPKGEVASVLAALPGAVCVGELVEGVAGAIHLG